MSTPMRLHRSLVLLLVAVLSFWASPDGILSAQTFTEGISVMVVEIPVQVLRGGRPIRGISETATVVCDLCQGETCIEDEASVIDGSGQATGTLEPPLGLPECPHVDVEKSPVEQ